MCIFFQNVIMILGVLDLLSPNCVKNFPVPHLHGLIETTDDSSGGNLCLLLCLVSGKGQ